MQFKIIKRGKYPVAERCRQLNLVASTPEEEQFLAGIYCVLLGGGSLVAVNAIGGATQWRNDAPPFPVKLPEASPQEVPHADSPRVPGDDQP